MTLPALLDVALGLSLVFFVLASVGSLLAELWAGHQKLRHHLLRNTVNRLLGDDIAERFWEHSLILPLYEPPPAAQPRATSSDRGATPDGPSHPIAAGLRNTWRVTTRLPHWMIQGRRAVAPGYLDAQLFATVVLDLASGQGEFGPIPNDRASWEAAIKANIAEIHGEGNDLEDHLLALLRQIPSGAPDTAGALRAAVTRWYQEAMQRASGTYRRKTQRSLLAFGLLLALGLNVDTVRLVHVLYLNPQLRANVAAQASALASDPAPRSSESITEGSQRTLPTMAPPATEAPGRAATTPQKGESDPAANAASAEPAPADPTNAVTTPRAQLQESVAQLRDLAKIGFPLGWPSPAEDSFLFRDAGELTWASWLAKILGLAASALAVCLGAPFWFDVVGRLVKLRSSGGADAEKTRAANVSTGQASDAPPTVSTSAVSVSGLRASSGSDSDGSAPSAAFILPSARPPSAIDALSSLPRPGLDVARAYWLAEFADHAYETNPVLLNGWLQQHGFTLRSSFHDAETDTQGFLATAGDLAVLAFRGTEQKLDDWLTDAKADQIADPVGIVPGVLHRGFINAFNSIAASVGAEFDALKTRGATLHVTGHSLGAALATLASLHCEARASSAGLVASVHTFGSPRVGDPVFAAAFARALRGRAFRFVNHEDIVTRVPPPRLPLRGREWHYSHVGEMTYIDADGRILGDVTFMFRLLNFATYAIGDAKSAVVTTLKDHSMQRYCDSLRRAT